MTDLPRLALFQPDIPQNAGALLRLAACLGIGLDVIEPCGFLWDERRMRRAGMDYAARVAVVRHSGFAAFDTARRGGGGGWCCSPPGGMSGWTDSLSGRGTSSWSGARARACRPR